MTNAKKTRFYDMGNIGDMLKHGMMAEFISWWSSINHDKKKFVFLDPFCGCPWDNCPNPVVIERLEDLGKLRDKYGQKFEIINAQSDFGKSRYYGSTHVAIHQIRSCGLLPDVYVSDKENYLTDELTNSDNKNIKKIECEYFCPSCGYSILKSIIKKTPFADMVLIDPFYRIDKIMKITSEISQASEKTAIVLFVLIKVNKNDTSKWEDICNKLNKNSIILTCPPLKGTTVCGEGYYKVGVILMSHLLADAEASKLRKKLKCYAAALTEVTKKFLDGQTITCD